MALTAVQKLGLKTSQLAIARLINALLDVATEKANSEPPSYDESGWNTRMLRVRLGREIRKNPIIWIENFYRRIPRFIGESLSDCPA